jgi:hypothetical protein
MSTPLNQLFQIHRRYHRSINLERDLGKPATVEGYVLTERSAVTLARILPALTQGNAHRAWTVTGVYGTGKSAFVHFLTSLCLPVDHEARVQAMQVVQDFLPEEDSLWDAIEAIPPSGLVPAIVTARQEPLTWTLVRALVRGADEFFPKKERRSQLLKTLFEWEGEVVLGRNTVQPQDILGILQDLVEKAEAPVLLVVDELGKNLEYAAQYGGKDDLYLLQQIAELSLKGEYQVYFLGLLHQSFAGYSDRLSVTEQNEWVKIQGRFEDIPFSESPTQMLRLMGQVIRPRETAPDLEASWKCDLERVAQAWYQVLTPHLSTRDLSADLLRQVYPLHPLTALVLPLLCQRYAQNDRSLFTFLTSDEPQGFKSFLDSHALSIKSGSNQIGIELPTLQLAQLYDYFVETVPGLASRLNFQRWVEVKGLIEDAQHQPPEVICLLKTIGVLNLVGTSGDFRATPALVAWALCDRPNTKLQQSWLNKIKDLKQKTLITHRKAQDELRLWQGSDFDIETAMREVVDRDPVTVAQLLASIYPLKPVVAQRHYTQTGNLRYFEQRYGNSTLDWDTLKCSDPGFDGLVLYWLDAVPLPEDTLPEYTVDGKPLIVIQVKNLGLLQTRSRELQGLKQIFTEAKPLQTDKVALREVRHRLVEAERLLDRTIATTLRWSQTKNKCWITGNWVQVTSDRAFQVHLSNLCDRVYDQSLRLDNELINRWELTSQGAKAQRELIKAMLEQGDRPRLGLQGYGPEVAIYYSVLQATSIHRQEDDLWGFYPPPEDSGVFTVWQAIAEFCFSATQQQRSLQELYQRLHQPPYGVKSGTIPILLAAVLLWAVDEISVYKEGTFIPVLGPEHFELLVKDPARFAVKHIAVAGVRSQVFRELEAVLRSAHGESKGKRGVRNLTLLAVVKPLLNFALGLPKYTRNTQRLSPPAYQVLRALLQNPEPDTLIFQALPQACGLEPIGDTEGEDGTIAKTLRVRLVDALREIHSAYDRLLTDCRQLLYNAFGLREDGEKLREDLRYRSEQLLGSVLEPSLRRFAQAALDRTADNKAASSDRQWLEAVVMVIADKPAESWKDEDVTRFELTLSDLSRRFKNLEALQTQVRADRERGVESRRLTVTRPDGSEVHQLVWMDPAQQQQVDPIIDQLLARCPENLQQVLLTRLTERVFESGEQTVPRRSQSNETIVGSP